MLEWCRVCKGQATTLLYYVRRKMQMPRRVPIFAVLQTVLPSVYCTVLYHKVLPTLPFCLQIVLLLRLVPIFPVGIMNYVLSVTPISMGTYIVASWLGMMVSGVLYGSRPF